MIAALAPPTRPVHAQMWRTLRVLLPESRGKGRGEGGREEQSFSELGLGKIDGALVLSGATGFIGSHILYQLLCVAEELGVSRIVLLVRGRHDADNDCGWYVAETGREACASLVPADRVPTFLTRTSLFQHHRQRFAAGRRVFR